MNWDDVRVFVALVRAGSLSLAGRELKIEHSTVVRRIDSLEKALGLRLFDRLPRGWQLTTEGEQLFARAEQMDDCAHAFLREASDGAALSGTVRMSALPAFATAFLTPRLVALQERWAPITLELVGETRAVSLSRREADLALRMGKPTDPTVVARPLGAISYGLFAHKDYLAQHAAKDWHFVGFDESLRDAPEQQWLDRYAAGRPYSFKSNSSLMLYEAAINGLGVTVLPHFLAMKSPDLVPVAVDSPPAKRDLWLVIHPELRRSARVKLVAEVVTELVLSSAEQLCPTR
ncbi:LysR substrate-binding domain-containing protein [Noviherbaspirillum agri]